MVFGSLDKLDLECKDLRQILDYGVMKREGHYEQNIVTFKIVSY